MHIILLSGGMGKRLWPLSEAAKPKQFLQMFPAQAGACSMVQAVYKQLRQAGIGQSITLCAGEDQRDIICDQLGEVQVAWEPFPRDTFPAIALSCAYLLSEQKASPDDAAAVVPIDTHAGTAFYETLAQLPAVLRKTRAQVALIGNTPTRPDRQYGYIVPASEQNGVVRVAKFVEKPSCDKAAELIRKGALWNTGVFCFRLGMMQQWLQEYDLRPEYGLLYRAFARLPKKSFDYQVLEHCKHIAAIRYTGTWQDLGSWRALTEVLPPTHGPVIQQDCENVFVYNTLAVPTMTLGIRDVIVVATPQGILVTDAAHTAAVKKMQSQTPPCQPETTDP